MSVLCLSRAAVPAVWLSSLCAPSDDKIAALSQAITHEAKGHLRNDRASMTDVSRSCLSNFILLCRNLLTIH